MTGPFFDGYADGLYGTEDHAHLHTEGRALAKYLDGRRCGEVDRNAGALEPAEVVSP